MFWFVIEKSFEKFWLTCFGRPQIYQNILCFGNSQNIYQNFIRRPIFAIPLGLAILQISITILDRHNLSQPLPNEVLSHKTHTQTHHNNQQDEPPPYLTLQRLCQIMVPSLPYAILSPRAVGIALAVVGLLAWGGAKR